MGFVAQSVQNFNKALLGPSQGIDVTFILSEFDLEMPQKMRTFWTICVLSIFGPVIASGDARAQISCESLELSGQVRNDVPIKEFVWKPVLTKASSVAEQLGELYLALSNTGRLPTKRVPMDHLSDVHQIVIDARAWIGPPTKALDALLCDMNPELCTRQRSPYAPLDDKSLKLHSLGHRLSPGQWSISAPTCLRIPAFNIEASPLPVERQEVRRMKKIRKVRREAKVRQNCVKIIAGVGRLCNPEVVAIEKPSYEVIYEDLDGTNADYPASGLWVADFDIELALPEFPGPSKSTFESSIGLVISDPGYRKLIASIGDHLIGSFKTDFESTGSAAAFERPYEGIEISNGVRDIFVSENSGASKTVVTIVDRVPDYNHCELVGAPILNRPFNEKLNERMRRVPPAERVGLFPNCGKLRGANDLDHGTHILGMLFATKDGKGASGILADLPGFEALYYPHIDQPILQPKDAIKIGKSLREAVRLYGTPVINLSWSYPPPEAGTRDIIREHITSLNALVVVAAGKDGQNGDEVCRTMPACYSYEYKNMISVIGVQRNEDGKYERLKLKSSTPGINEEVISTNYGESKFQIAALGKKIMSTVTSNTLGSLSGSSQSAPQVSALAAMIASVKKMTPLQLKNRIIYSSKLVDELFEFSRGGLPDFDKALNLDRDVLSLNGDVNSNEPCEVEGEVAYIKRENIGRQKQIMMVTAAAGALEEIRIDEIRRMHRLENGSYLIFSEDSHETLTRSIGKLNGPLAEWSLVFKAVTRGEKCLTSEKTVSLEHVRDWVGRMQ